MLERAGIQRADMVIAVTGDDEDNMLICQVAKEKYLVDQIIARVNNPRNRQHFDLLGVKPSVSATDLILRLLEHEVPEYGLVHLLDLQEEQLEIIEMLLGKDSRRHRPPRRRPADARGQPADLGPARRQGLRAERRHGAGGGRRGPRRPRSRARRTTSRCSSDPARRRQQRWPDREVDFLLVGGGMASAYCASELRKQGAEGSILLVGREPEPPYERPPLSQGVPARRGRARRRPRQARRPGTPRTGSSC